MPFEKIHFCKVHQILATTLVVKRAHEIIYTTLSLEKSERAYLKQVTDNKNKISFSKQMQNLVCTLYLVQSKNPNENKFEAPVTSIPAEEQYHSSCIRLQLTVIGSVSY